MKENVDGGVGVMECGWRSESLTIVGSSWKLSAVMWEVGRGTDLVDVFVFECSRPTEGRSEVLIEAVCAPEQASSTLELQVVYRAWGITLLTSM